MRRLGSAAGPGRTAARRPRSRRPAVGLLERYFDAAAPNRRWVADIAYVQTFLPAGSFPLS